MTMSGPGVKKREGIWPGLVFAAFGAWQTYEATNISTRSLVPNDPVSSATLPIVLGVLTFLTGVALLVRRYLRVRLADSEESEELPDTQPVNRQAVLRVTGAIVATIVYALLLPRIGYVIATPLAVAIFIGLATIERPRPITTALVAVILSTACYLLFVVVIKADIPAWPT